MSVCVSVCLWCACACTCACVIVFVCLCVSLSLSLYDSEFVCLEKTLHGNTLMAEVLVGANRKANP